MSGSLAATYPTCDPVAVFSASEKEAAVTVGDSFTSVMMTEMWYWPTGRGTRYR